MKKINFYGRIVTLVMCLLLICTTAFTQEQQVTVNLKNASIEKLFAVIENQTTYRFSYRNILIGDQKDITISENNISVALLLENVLTAKKLAFKVISDESIVISDKQQNVSQVKYSAKKIKITGTVLDELGIPMPGVTVMILGTTVGMVTSIDGHYSIDGAQGETLSFSFIGYKTQLVKVNTKTILDVKLETASFVGEEVVITALGIKRSEKALGYSVQNVGSDDLPAAKTLDIATSLTGKVAGLNIQNSTEFSENASIKLRGETPLLIVDGVPYGNISLNEIASDDIESLSVLKGATASALYGSRGSSGAIMVTTKKGADNEGVSVTINSNTMFFAGFLAFPETHSSYSRGWNGEYNNDFVWGDKLDIGRTAIQYNPSTYEWEETELTSRGKDNFNNFLEPSVITNNNISFAFKSKYGSVRSSITYAYNKGQYPNQELNKFTYFVGGDIKYKKFALDAGLTYNKRLTSNDNGSGYSSSYIYDLVIWGAADYDLMDYKNYWVAGKENVQQNWYDKNWYDNPYFKANEVVDSWDYDILNAYFNTSYEVTSWLKAMLRTGIDVYSKKNEWWNAKSANYSWHKDGSYGISRASGYSLNTDAMLMADKTWGSFNMNVLVGGNIYYYSDDKITGTTAGGLTVPGFYSLQASVDPASVSSSLYRKRVNSLYSKLSLSWAGTYFVDITGRNDWSSTLSEADRSYFYPSVSGSVVLSQIFELPEVWDFWKIRGSWTSTKSDASVYANNMSYGISTNQWGSYTSASYPSSIIGGSVRPKKSDVLEVGTSMNFFSNRLFADFAYYKKNESDFIINGGISPSTGYTGIQVNFGEERSRRGLELTVGGAPIKTDDFEWNIVTNWANDKYEYKKIDPKYSTKKPWVAPGLSWDWMSIYEWDRDPNGNIIHNAGLPIKQNFDSKIGNTAPDLVWGITNTFRYKQFALNLTIDGRLGGKSYSRTHQMLMNSGSGIDSDTPERYDQVVNGAVNYVGQGVKVISGSVDRDAQGNIISDTREYAPNDVHVTYETYTKTYHDSTNRPSSQNVLDETFFKIRNLSVTYNVPNLFCDRLSLKDASISFTAQNLYLWAKEYKYADPDKGGDSSGYESLNSPSQRMLGVNVVLNF